jgi:hypothetical protein
MQSKEAYENMIKVYNERKDNFGLQIPDLFLTVDNIKSPELAEAMQFLIAYAPLSDLVNKQPEYFKSMAELSLRTKTEFSWGQSVPSDVFMHFVLPYRVNNEDPDLAREVFLPELKERVRGLNMYDAALEVNHWCHEKVAYRPTDERTSAPLATIKTAYGRCGEESTFTVAAMRSIGIPARQVYTPRWAHTDDNHAWVEVWIDGKWYFLGACEPDPELNMGWFSEPVTRAIMVHTNTFGKYYGSENTLVQKPLYSKLNLLSNYAPSKQAVVRVVDRAGNPLENMSVDYQVYNYSEFFPFALMKTDKNGRCSIETAYGDLMIWVTDGKEFTWKLFPAEMESELEIVFEPYSFDESNSRFEFQILPPPLGKIVVPETSKKEENDRRLKEEDSLRASYEATFPDTAYLREKYKNNHYREAIVNFILKSRGNYKEIESFISNAGDIKSAVDLLFYISEKDLHDTPESVLMHHLKFSKKFKCNKCTDEIFARYVLCPRIGREMLSPWRGAIQSGFSKKDIKSFRKDPAKIVSWINDNIRIDDENNYYGVTIFPENVLKLRAADKYSRNVFFVACCRSFGIPARLEAATYIPQYYWQGKWKSVFRKADAPEVEKTNVKLTSLNFEPKYYINYTVAKLIDGRFVSLDYEYDESMNIFPITTNIEPGMYRIMTGNRFPDGSVLTNWHYIIIPVTKDTILIELNLQENTVAPEPLFSFANDFEMKFANKDSVISFSKIIKDSCNIIALIDPSTEPGKHFLHELSIDNAEFDTLNRNIYLVIPGQIPASAFNANAWPNLPKSVIWLHDYKGDFSNQLKSASKSDLSLPEVLFVIDNMVYYRFSGYHINTASMLLNIYNRKILK